MTGFDPGHVQEILHQQVQPPGRLDKFIADQLPVFRDGGDFFIIQVGCGRGDDGDRRPQFMRDTVEYGLKQFLRLVIEFLLLCQIDDNLAFNRRGNLDDKRFKHLPLFGILQFTLQK